MVTWCLLTDLFPSWPASTSSASLFSLSLSLFNSTILIILRNLVLSFLTLLYSFLILPYISFLYGVLFTVLRPEYPVIRNRITTASLSADFPCSSHLQFQSLHFDLLSLALNCFSILLSASLSLSLSISLLDALHPPIAPSCRPIVSLVSRSFLF